MKMGNISISEKDLVGKTINEVRDKVLGRWWILDVTRVNPGAGYYQFVKFPYSAECWTNGENIVVAAIIHGL